MTVRKSSANQADESWARTFSEASRQNQAFAAENRCGMQALTIQYLFLSNSEDVAAWQNELDRIAEATASGLAKAMRIPTGS